MTSELPLEKARKKLGLPCPAMTKPAPHTAPPVEPAEEKKVPSEDTCSTAAEIDETQLNIFSPGESHSLPDKKLSRRKSSAKKDKTTTKISDHNTVQQDLFGEAKEEAS